MVSLGLSCVLLLWWSGGLELSCLHQWYGGGVEHLWWPCGPPSCCDGGMVPLGVVLCAAV